MVKLEAPSRSELFADEVDGLYPFGSYGPVGGREAIVWDACAAAGVKEAVEGSIPAADFDAVFGAEVSLSASEFAGENGGTCGLAPACDAVSDADAPGVVADDADAAARFVDDGGDAGVRPAIATACGFDWADGSAGSLDFATAAASVALSFFHQAHRGPDWQPANVATAATSIIT